MDSRQAESSEKSRDLLFGLLVNCIFVKSAGENCPLWKLINTLSIEEKQNYVMGLSDVSVRNILQEHEECYQKKLSELLQD